MIEGPTRERYTDYKRCKMEHRQAKWRKKAKKMRREKTTGNLVFFINSMFFSFCVAHRSVERHSIEGRFLHRILTNLVLLLFFVALTRSCGTPSPRKMLFHARIAIESFQTLFNSKKEKYVVLKTLGILSNQSTFDFFCSVCFHNYLLF